MSDDWPHLPGCPGDPEWAHPAPCLERCPVRLREELAAYKKAKAENDERFMTERDEARAERDMWKRRAEMLLGRRGGMGQGQVADFALSPPAPTPPPAMHDFHIVSDGETVVTHIDGREVSREPAKPTPLPCASWCGVGRELGVGVEAACKMDPTCWPSTDMEVTPWREICYCTPACRDAGAPRNPVKPCETCGGGGIVKVHTITAPFDATNSGACHACNGTGRPSCTPGAKPAPTR